jgi:hypothetical protein
LLAMAWRTEADRPLHTQLKPPTGEDGT